MRYCVGVIGYGYWGPVLLRNFHHHEGFYVKWVCDRNMEHRKSAKTQCGTVQVTDNPSDLLLDNSIDVVVIATQASTHYTLCREVLLHGKHVFVEKPLALSFAEAEELCRMSEMTRRTVFVDHTWLFSSGYRKLREVLQNGALGKILRINSRRCDFGLFQRDANVVWHLMYHDVYLLNDLLGSAPLQVQANGTSAVLPSVIDGASATLSYPGGVQANVLCDMYFPEKMRELIVQCERGILVWDEMQQDRLYVVNRYAASDPSTGGVNYYGDGARASLPVDEKETLSIVLDEFYNKISDFSLGNCHSALQTVKTIEMLNRSLIKAENDSTFI